MKNVLLSSVFTLMVWIPSFAQPTLFWESAYHGAIADDQPNAMAVDDDGNVYVTGYTDTPGETTDYLTIKYNADGDILWTRTYNGAANGDDVAHGLKVDASGNVYVTGQSQGTGDGVNMMTIKYNAGGMQQWAAVHSGATNSINIGYNIATDVFGNVYAAGGNNVNGGVLVKYNASGTAQWTADLPGRYQNEVLVLIHPNDGNIIVAGGISHTGIYYVKSINPSNGALVRSYNANVQDFALGLPIALELDGAGNMIVTSTSSVIGTSNPTQVETAKYLYPGANNQSYAWRVYSYVDPFGPLLSGAGMQLDNDNNVYVAMSFYNGSFFTFTLRKLSPNGASIWRSPPSGVGVEGAPVAMALSNLSDPPDIYVAGYDAVGDFKMVKYSNANGNVLWTTTYDCGNSGSDIAGAMVTDNCDNIYIAGTSSCSGTFKDVKTVKFAVATPPAVTPDGPTTFCQGGSVTLTAEEGNTYLWSNGATVRSITVTTSGNYTVTITNADGCPQASLPVEVTVVPPPTASIAPAGVVTVCENSTAVLTASPANAYQWSNGATTPSITVAEAGDYWVTVSNAAGCTAVSAVTTVELAPAPTATVSPPGPVEICQGSSAMLTASPANAYLWNTGATTQSITATETGAYWVTVTNTDGCAAVSTATMVTVLPLPIAAITPDGEVEFCQGSSVTLTANPANAYRWSTGDSTQSITVSNPGEYLVTVTSGAGCSAVAGPTILIGIPAPVATITPVGDLEFCEGGSVVLQASQANAYLWSTGEASQVIVADAGGDYSVTVTNAAGCTGDASIAVTEWPVATLSLMPTDTDCGETNGRILTTVSGGSPIESYLWSNGETTQHLFGLSGGAYSVTATDVNGCTATAEATVVGRVNPTVTIESTTQGQEVELAAVATGTGLTYLWSTGETTPTITVDGSGTYTVTVTNSQGCSASAFEVIVSTSDKGINHQITLFPNPATDVLHIKCEGAATASVRLLNVLGKQLLEDQTLMPDGATRTLRLDNVPPGSYFIEVAGRDFRKALPFVKTGN
ncbi:MAG: SBBP repeat-containing protein [Phaeodactylibacter sp.]|nr:SBBP repeat-containing protein [Phaeodactylibacter sp.]